MVQEIEAGQYQVIMSCSGDGVLHEMINALVHRPDWETFKETVVISMIPGGTSNGYCTSVLKSMDLVALDGEFEPATIYMFLMFNWGLIADIAQNSENMRCLGTGRYTVRALYRMCWMPQYPGTLTFKGVKVPNLNEWYQEKDGIDLSEPGDPYEAQQFSYFVAQPMQWSGTTVNFAPLTKIGDGTMDFMVSTQATGAGKMPLLRGLLDQASGAFWDHRGHLRPDRGLEYVKATEFVLDPQIKSEPHEGSEYQRQPGYVYDNFAHISIDGERYKSQKFKAKVLQGVFPILI